MIVCWYVLDCLLSFIDVYWIYWCSWFLVTFIAFYLIVYLIWYWCIIDGLLIFLILSICIDFPLMFIWCLVLLMFYWLFIDGLLNLYCCFIVLFNWFVTCLFYWVVSMLVLVLLMFILFVYCCLILNLSRFYRVVLIFYWCLFVVRLMLLMCYWIFHWYVHDRLCFLSTCIGVIGCSWCFFY